MYPPLLNGSFTFVPQAGQHRLRHYVTEMHRYGYAVVRIQRIRDLAGVRSIRIHLRAGD